MTAPRVERRLAAILAADVVGYSRLMGGDEQGTLERLKTLRRELVDALIAEHRGRIVKLMGDGTLVEFASVVDAVACAVAVQQGMAGRELDLPAAERMRFRIGVNLGDVIVEGDDIYGEGVNVAARLEGLAEPGGVCVSGKVREELRKHPHLSFAPLGRQKVKNIVEPVEAWRVVSADAPLVKRLPQSSKLAWRTVVVAGALLLVVVGLGGWWYWTRGSTAASGKPAIAVLPFDNLGGDAATGRLADGITEDTITDLARFRNLDVITRNSTAAYQGKSVDVRQVGRELNVGYVLTGSIQRAGDKVRITAQLVDAGSGAHVWSDRWDRPAEDVFAIQTEIAEQAANQIGGHRLADQGAYDAALRKRPENLAAYELYLLGTGAKTSQTEEGTEEAIRLLTRAVELDPHLARAWVVLSYAYSDKADRAVDGGVAFRQQQLDAARRAVAADPLDAVAHSALGNVEAMLGDLTQSKAELEQALRLNPGEVHVLTDYAGFASSFGEPAKGAEAADRLIRLDPDYPIWATNGLNYAYFMAGRYEDCLRVLARMPEEMMNTPQLLIQQAAALAALGRMDEARPVVAKALERYPGISIERYASRPDFAAHERQRNIETMGKAGFPACAKPAELTTFQNPVRLPECEAERAKAAVAKT